MSSLSSSSSSFSTPHSTFFSNNKEEGEIDSLSSSSSFHWTPFYPLEDRKTQPSSSFMTPSLHVLQTQTPMKSTNESPFLHLESSSTGSTPFGATSSPHPHRFSGTSSAILQQNLMQQDPFNLTSETTTPFSSCVSNETLQKPLPCPIPPSPSFSNLSTVAPPPPNPNPPLITPSTPLLNYSTPCVQPLTSTLNSKKDPLLFKPPPLGPSTPCPVAGDHTHRTASVRPLLASRLSTSSSMMGSFLPTCKVEFLKLLNVGGQGVIFLAQLVEDPHSWVVVKVFYKTPTDYELECLRKVSISTYCIRLIMETRVSKAMVLRYSEALHAEKVSIHSFTFDAEGYAMGYCYEHLYGDLERAILDRKRRIPNTLKCLIALQIAYFLKTVHRLGYIFRDLKPSNVLLNIPIFSGYTPISEDQVLQYYKVKVGLPLNLTFHSLDPPCFVIFDKHELRKDITILEMALM
ncbi:hypothetical protein HMI54_014504 [Coelomomyces lativittatus]|nr:hypothetical protein HMI54_014504 [Coelomomyces lativittatus]